MNDLVQRIGLDFLAASWLPQVLTVIGAVTLLNIGAHYLLRHIEKIAARTATVWDDALIKATRKPLTLILWVAGATYAIRIVHQHLGTPVPDFVLPTAARSSSSRWPGSCCG